MTQPLTPIERRVYEYLLDFTAENTFQPSIREIGRQFRIRSTKTVSDILQSLAAKGLIERDASRSRGVRLLGFSGAASARPVPYYGQIHAGEPALLPEHRAGYFTVDRRFLPSDSVFMLRVDGDSMNGAGVLDGDYVLVDPEGAREEVPDPSKIVVVRLGEKAALKHVVREGDRLVLRASNPAVADEAVAAGEQLHVLGVVCGIFRPFHDSGPVVTRDLGAEAGANLADVACESPDDATIPDSRGVGRVLSLSTLPEPSNTLMA